MKLTFYMDVSPNWWIKARIHENFLKQYVFEKFERDYYPRIIIHQKEKIDLDKSGKSIKTCILEKLQFGNFEYEFLPEDETLKESYSISNGYVHFHPRRKMTNSRLLIIINDISYDQMNLNQVQI